MNDISIVYQDIVVPGGGGVDVIIPVSRGVNEITKSNMQDARVHDLQNRDRSPGVSKQCSFHNTTVSQSWEVKGSKCNVEHMGNYCTSLRGSGAIWGGNFQGISILGT